MATPINTVTCIPLTSIDGTDCIGDSRVILNNNITNLGTTVCYLSTLINALSSNMSSILNVPYARLSRRITTNDTLSAGRNTITYTNTDTNINASFLVNVNTTTGAITLAPGTYQVKLKFSAVIPPAYPATLLLRGSLQSNGTSTDIIAGTNGYVQRANSAFDNWLSFMAETDTTVEGRFTVASQGDYSAILTSTGTATVSAISINTIASVAEFWKLA